MPHLGHARSGTVKAAPDHPCVEAFGRELGYIFATLRRLGARSFEVDDLAQDIFVVLHRNWSIIDTTRPLRPYLFGIAFRIFSADRKRRAREIPFAEVEVEDEAPNPEARLDRKESDALLLAALDRLPLRRRAVVVMHELDQIPVAEIARTLSMTQFGIYARLKKARKELRMALRRLSKDEKPI